MTNLSKLARSRFLLPAVVLFGAAAVLVMQPARAVETAAETGDLESERFELQRDGDDFIRLDKRSGQMSICRKRSGQLVCQMAADDREAIEKEFDSLLDRLDRLEAKLEEQDDDTRERHSYRWDDEDFDEFEKELDDALDFSARFFKRFYGKMKDWRYEFRDLYKE
ncbi:MAG: hypothetical protein KDJ69_00050 [Nitratireductor sp.]|nr:hypothetical protein [Nitratireductor sp.]